MSQIPADSVPLAAAEAARKAPEAAPRLRVANVKLIVALFAIFLFVVSNTFTNSVIAGFGEGAVLGGKITTGGVVLQGVFLVIFYILAVYLTERNLL